MEECISMLKTAIAAFYAMLLVLSPPLNCFFFC